MFLQWCPFGKATDMAAMGRFRRQQPGARALLGNGRKISFQSNPSVEACRGIKFGAGDQFALALQASQFLTKPP